MAVQVKRLFYRGVSSSGGIATRSETTFDVVNWVLHGSGNYIISVPYSTHLISSNPAVTVYLDNTTSFEEVEVPVEINSSGDVTIYVSSTNRFKGKLIIL